MLSCCNLYLYVFIAGAEVAQIIAAAGEALSVPAPGMQEEEHGKGRAHPEGIQKQPDFGMASLPGTSCFMTCRLLKQKELC